jgi:type III pantothenate kinase
MHTVASNLIAVDIGNSRIKIGRFNRAQAAANAAQIAPQAPVQLPEPLSTCELPITNHAGQFDTTRLRTWCDDNIHGPGDWLIASVHRGATKLLSTTLRDGAKQLQHECVIRQLNYRDVSLAIDVEEPARVGIDRLLAALAANRLRRADRAAIVVDLGTAITVDLLTADGTFAGGAILPGIAMSARALAEQTDALPHVLLDEIEHVPPLGKSTEAAIRSGLLWGAIGAIRELARGLSAELSMAPDMFVTGGASPVVAELLGANSNWSVRHVPHLVLAGIALVDAEPPGEAGG